MMLHKLALAFQRTIPELVKSMDSNEIGEWISYFLAERMLDEKAHKKSQEPKQQTSQDHMGIMMALAGGSKAGKSKGKKRIVRKR